MTSGDRPLNEPLIFYYAGCYLAHNLMLISMQTYYKRQPTLIHYIELLDWLISEGIECQPY